MLPSTMRISRRDNGAMIGTTVSHYRVVERLGAGGMGVVYRAEDLRLGRHVALKFLPDSALADPLAIERFQREARTASALNHPNICTIHDVGEHEGHRFLVMELIDGTTLDRALAAGPLPVDRVVDVSSQIADALDAAHSEGILHRDVKPGNVFITRRGQVKVVDFGLAKMMERVGSIDWAPLTLPNPHLSTSAGIAVGTVAYMSPEHARGEGLDPRSDLFSLGIVMYEMATGVQTFKGQTTAVVFDQILNRVPAPPSLLNPNVPLSLEHIIGRLLEKDRQLRYQTARDLHSELQRLRRDMESRRFVLNEGAVSVASAWAHHSGPHGQSAPTDTGLASAHVFPTVAEAVLTPPPRALSDEVPTIFVPPPARAAADAPAPPAVEAQNGATTAAKPEAPAAAPREEPTLVPAAISASTPAAEQAQPTLAPAAVPAPRARKGMSWRVIGGIAAAAVVVVGTVGTIVYLSQGSVPIGAGEGVDRAARQKAAVATPSPGPTEPSPSPAPAPSSAPPAATTTPEPAPPPAPPPPAAVPAAKAAAPSRTANTGTPPSGTTAPDPAPAIRASRSGAALAAAQQTEAAKLIEAAKGQLASGAEADGLAALASVANTYAATPAAPDALAIIAQTHQDAGRFAEAIGAWTDLGRRGGAAERASEGLIRAADAAAKLKTPATDQLARGALGELLAQYPSSVRSLRALQMKMALEDRMKLREQDAEFQGSMPTSLLTLRSVARDAGTTPVAEFALWRLAAEYKDRRLQELAAKTFAELATRFPETRYDAWFSAAEIYEKQLRRSDEARAAYAKVPTSSPNYHEAQKRAQSGS
jgi:serine/threonine protein kinase/tetratricopeptide (TPR) repeat protein